MMAPSFDLPFQVMLHSVQRQVELTCSPFCSPLGKLNPAEGGGLPLNKGYKIPRLTIKKPQEKPEA